MRYPLYRSLFVIFLVCELLLATSQRLRYMSHRENAIVLLLVAALMGLFAVLAAFEKTNTKENPSETAPWEHWMLKIVLGLGLALSAFHFYREISVIPIDVKLSDILPTIQVMDKRLLSGQYPYSIIQEFGYDLNPTYLPLMWMPFLPAVLFHFDERWMAFLIWAIAAVALIWRAHQQGVRTEAKWLITVLPFFFFVLIEEGTDATYGNTIEIMIAGFYMLFALQLAKIRQYLSGSPVKGGLMMAFFIALCLLSRYAFLLWLPLCFLVVWGSDRKLALSTAAGVLGAVLLLFVLPFLSQDPMIYLNGLKYYSVAALTGWEQVGHPTPLYDGMGVAGIFRDELGGDMASRLSVLQRWQFLSSMAAVAICALIWWKKRAQMQHLSLFLLGSLKFYFAFFYGFIQMPYTYLMLTPCFFSIAMLVAWYQKAESTTVLRQP